MGRLKVDKAATGGPFGITLQSTWTADWDGE
jgi:hypothetical protein